VEYVAGSEGDVRPETGVVARRVAREVVERVFHSGPGTREWDTSSSSSSGLCGFRHGSVNRSSRYVRQPIPQTTFCGIDGGVRTVDADAGGRETQQAALLRVEARQAFQAAEDYGVCPFVEEFCVSARLQYAPNAILAFLSSFNLRKVKREREGESISR